MKKILLLLLAVSILGAQSCKDKDPEPEEEISLIGSWNLETIHQNNGRVKENGITTSTFLVESSHPQGLINFAPNGIYNANIGYTLKTTIHPTSGKEEVLHDQAPVKETAGSYIHDNVNNTLIFRSKGINTVYRITKLTDTKLVLAISLYKKFTHGPNIIERTSDAVTTYTR